MTMKKLMILMLILIAGFTACNKDQTMTTQTTATAQDLPLKATSYIENNYPDATIDFVVAYTSSDAAYIVTLNTTEELAFSEAGDYLGNGVNFHGGHGHHGGGDTIFHDSTHWGDTTHPGDTTHNGGHGHGHHGGGHHGGGHHGGGHHGGGIPLDSLSAAIVQYINTNFPGDTIFHAEYDSLCPEGAVIAVMFGQRGTEPKKAVFDLAGTYLLLANRLRYEEMPDAVKNYITSNYANYQVCHRGEKFTMADNTLQYRVFLMPDHVRMCVRLKEDGTLVCVR
jgi:hypothetical protein